MDDVTTAKTTLLETLRYLDREWQAEVWPHDGESRPRSYYGVAADRIDRLELALHQIVGHGNITAERARQVAAEALGVEVPT